MLFITRRQSQLTDGGFHGSPNHKYTEIGDVVLNDGSLILQALGQVGLHGACVCLLDLV